MKKLITALILIMLLLPVSCAKLSPPAPTPTPAPGPAPALAPETFIKPYKKPGRYSFLLGEDIFIGLSFENVSKETFRLEPFPPEIKILRRPPYNEVVRSFPAGTGSKSLEPGEYTFIAADYTLFWDQRDDQGQQVPYGRYLIKLGGIRYGEGWMPLNFERAVWVIIQPAEGAIEKDIQVNESQTVNGIAITLEEVVLSDIVGVKFYAFNTPPDYRLPQDPKSPPPHLVLDAEAEYSLDGGLAIKAGSSYFSFYENGMRHSWKHLDPVPKGTKEIIFTITRLGDWEGPWEFRVPIGLTLDDIDIYTDAEETISASVGDEFAISLFENPHLGLTWHENYDEKMLSLVEDPFIPKDKLAPVAGTRYFHFKALKKGKTEVTVTYQHLLDSPVSDQKVFKVDIK